MFKKTALAVALAGVTAAPFAAQADSGPTLYGRVDVGVEWVKTDSNTTDATESAADVVGELSRFGIKGDADLGGGLNGFYKFEFRINADTSSLQQNNRLSYIGMKSGFGSFSAGRQWSAYYNHVGTHVDPTEWVGTAAISTYQNRTSDILKYAGSFGPVSLEVDVMADGAGGTGDKNGVDRKTVGATVAAGPATIGVGYDLLGNGAADETKTIGAAGAVKVGGGFTVRGGYEQVDDNSLNKEKVINLGVLFASGSSTFMGGIGKVKDDDLSKDDKVYWLHAAQQIAKPTKAYVEIRKDIPDTGGSDVTTVRFNLSQTF